MQTLIFSFSAFQKERTHQYHVLPPKKSECRLTSHSQKQTWNMAWLQTKKGLRQGCILSFCTFYFYAEYIMWNARQDETQAPFFLQWSRLAFPTCFFVLFCFVFWNTHPVNVNKTVCVFQMLLFSGFHPVYYSIIITLTPNSHLDSVPISHVILDTLFPPLWILTVGNKAEMFPLGTAIQHHIKGPIK